MSIISIRNKLEQKKGMYKMIKKQINQKKHLIQQLKKEIKTSQKAHSIICKTAQETQQLIEYRINNLVTTALQDVFPDDPYQFKIEFIPRRNKTECNIFFIKNNKKYSYDEIGGGIIDIASFALRASLWAMSKKNDSVLIFDEPFKNINDSTRTLHKKIADMVKMICKRLKIQIVIITMIPEIQEVANQIIKVEKIQKASFIKTERR